MDEQFSTILSIAIIFQTIVRRKNHWTRNY